MAVVDIAGFVADLKDHAVAAANLPGAVEFVQERVLGELEP